MSKNTIRARSPLRLGLAGGGTDVSPYCDTFGGAVLNATIDLYAYATIQPRDDGRVRYHAADQNVDEEFEAGEVRSPMEGLRLHRGVHARMMRDFNDGKPLPLTLVTHVDSPMGSGLGSSSALVVAMIEAYREFLHLPLGEYDVAHLAFEIERVDCALNGGRQDQYAATFGGVNFMEFLSNDRVIVNPLRPNPAFMRELEASLVLYFTGVSRESARIIDAQSHAVHTRQSRPIEAMHQIKHDAVEMKEALLRGQMLRFAEILDRSWHAKKQLSDHVTNADIDRIYKIALSAGAYAGKVSGAGGGGFMMFIADPSQRPHLIRVLEAEEGFVRPCHFSTDGSQSWRVPT